MYISRMQFNFFLLFLQPSFPILRTRLRDEVKTLRQKYSETQRGDVGYSRLISFSPDCLSRGSMSPLLPPASTHSFGVDQSFSVDGQHLNCDGASRSASVNKLKHKLYHTRLYPSTFTHSL